MKQLSRHAHDERERGTGRYRKTELCDGCNKPVGTAYFTDWEVCGDSDGPGFHLCDRKRCMKVTESLTVTGRRHLYAQNREARKK